MPRWSWILTLLATITTPIAAEMAITFSDDAVRVSGLTPGTKAAWLSVARERPGWVTRVVRRDGVEMADGNGDLALAFDPVLSSNSGWVVVDLATGETAFGTPTNARWRLVAPTAGAAASSIGAAHLLQDDRQILQLMLARPGGDPSAWGTSVGDGGDADDNELPDGIVRARWDTLRPIGGSAPPPKTARDGDVLVAIDPSRGEAYTVHVGRLR